ncbi:hypothetical protein [Oceanispirochaeta sp.]|uniref:hypothetical protein n=1 Tax=Oceanispirochaeta sp. TaxID=2035350 RepID=UPI002621E212|nr:hypothetical protein [Oceanispirochaeta sp.]MDA3958627.1 hypothetical protein [Oceanispirochaeta sp.]
MALQIKKTVIKELEQELISTSNEPERPKFLPNHSGVGLPVLIWIFTAIILLLFYIIGGYIINNSQLNKTGPVEITPQRNDSLLNTFRNEAENTITQKTEEVSFYKQKVSDYDRTINYLQSLISGQNNSLMDSENEGLSEFKALTKDEIQQEILKITKDKQIAQEQIDKTKNEIVLLNNSINNDESSKALKKLTQYQSLQQRETILTNQIVGLYSLVIESIQYGNYENARLGLQSLETILKGNFSDGLNQSIKQETLYLDIADLMKDYILLKNNGDEVIVDQISGSLSEAERLIKNAHNQTLLGNNGTAIEYYRKGLALIPFMDLAAEEIRKFEQLKLEQPKVETEEKPIIENPTPPKPEVYAITQVPISEKFLLGVVQSLEDAQIVVKLLTKEKVSNGDKFIIKNLDLNGSETIVAQGTIESVSDSTATGIITARKERYVFRISKDLVFMISSS